MNIKKALAFTDTHCPLQDNDAIEWIKDEISKRKPDKLLMLGDLFEATFASKFLSSHQHELLDEYETAGKMLADIRKVAKKSNKNCEFYFLLGNHDTHLLNPERVDSRILEMLDFRNPNIFPEITNWKMPIKDYTYDPKVGCFALSNQVIFTHGFESNEEMQAIRLNQNRPFSLLVAGHLHRGKNVTQAMRTKDLSLPYWYCNAGCMKRFDKDIWAARNKSVMDWSHSYAYIEYQETKSPRNYRTWDAEVVTLRTRQEYYSG